MPYSALPTVASITPTVNQTSFSQVLHHLRRSSEQLHSDSDISQAAHEMLTHYLHPQIARQSRAIL